MNLFFQDARFALRGFRKNPAFAAIAIFTLAIGIGANTSIFSVANALLLRQLPYPQPERLVLGSSERVVNSAKQGPLSWPRFQMIHDRNQSFAGVAAGSCEGSSTAFQLRLFRGFRLRGRGFWPGGSTGASSSISNSSTTRPSGEALRAWSERLACRIGSTRVPTGGVSRSGASSRPVAVRAESCLFIEAECHCPGAGTEGRLTGVGLFPTLTIAGSSKEEVFETGMA